MCQEGIWKKFQFFFSGGLEDQLAPSCHSSIPVGTFRSPPDTIIIAQAEERMQYFFEDFSINVSGNVDKNL